MSLETTTNLLKSDEDFRLFFSILLCRSNSGQEAASACVEAFYQPTDAELAAFCIPEAKYPQLQRCTEQNYLISPTVYNLVGKRGFRKKR